jgi:hypothetical protein
MSERECNPCECPDCRADTSNALRLEANAAALRARVAELEGALRELTNAVQCTCDPERYNLRPGVHFANCPADDLSDLLADARALLTKETP